MYNDWFMNLSSGKNASGEGFYRMMLDLQRASLWKRISAFLFDGIVLGVTAVLLGWFLSAALGFDGYSARLDACYERYGAEYGVDFHMTLEAYEGLTEAETQNLEKAYQALGADGEATYVYQMLIQLTLTITSVSLLLAYLALEFFVPLALKNGQTLGKKIFGIGLMRTEGVKISAVSLFIRTILGKYTVETMVPVLILLMLYFGSVGLAGTLLVGLMALAQLVLVFSTRNHSLIHDLLAGTVAVDIASQMIFDSREALLAYREKAHAEKVAGQSSL